jgi:hypothetical protein
MSPERVGPDGLTEPQRALAKWLTDQRVANLMQMADIIGDLDADAVQFLRILGHPSYESLRKFLLQAKPETFAFLTDLRKSEVEDIEEAIETARSLRRTGRVMKWGLVTLGAAFLGMVSVWDKLVAILSARGR